MVEDLVPGRAASGAEDDASSAPSGPAVLTELRAALVRQYRAALSMFREAVESCSDALWFDRRPRNAFWQVAYHTLFYTHLYLQPSVDAFRPWEGHQANVQHPDGIAGGYSEGGEIPLLPSPYTRAQVLAYARFVDANIDTWVAALDLLAADCGFPWYPIAKLEYQINNVRHVQHHTGQLLDRLRAAADVGVEWR